MESAVDKRLDVVLQNNVHQDIRNCFYTFDDFIKANVKNIIYSGSFVEGYSNINDLDFMICLSEYGEVVEDLKDIQRYNGRVFLLLESENLYPGYVRLQRITSSSHHNDDSVCNVPSGGQVQYLSRKQVFEIIGQQLVLPHQQNGPAIRINAVDIVCCFKIALWPSFAKGFLKRVSVIASKLSINEQTIRDIGCHVVPVSHPSSKEPDLVFRMSFSLCEKYLLRNWTNKQMRCYFLCRELNKQYFSDLGKAICSYFWKTAMLWLIEVKSKKFWSQPCLECIKKILDKMSGYLKEKSCPNYFIPQNLMMSTYTTEQCEQLQKIIEDVSKNLFLHILKCRYIRELFEDDEFESVKSICQKAYSTGYTGAMHKELESVFKQYEDLSEIKANTIYHARLYNMQRVLATEAMRVNNVSFSINPRLQNGNNSDFYECLKASFKRVNAFKVLELSFSAPSSNERLALLQQAEEHLTSSIHLPGVLNDHGFSGYLNLALFYYFTPDKERALKLLRYSCSLYDNIQNNLVKSSPLPIIIYPVSENTEPAYLINDEILSELYNSSKTKSISMDSLILAKYMEYQLTRDKSHLEVLKDIYSQRLEVYKHGVYGKIVSFPASFILYKLDLLNKDSEEYLHFTGELNSSVFSN